MRISTQTLFETGANQLGALQSNLVRTQQQISSGQRILNPSDDPIGAARALEITQSQSINTQYGANRQQAMGALTGVEGTLSSVTALLQEVQTTIVAAGNGVLSDNERGFQATELKGRLEALLGLANSRDALGNYQFAKALQRDERENEKRQRHAVRASDSTPHEKPGPIAVITVRLGRPAAMTRSSTNMTVGADMLPYSDNTARS